MLKTGPCRRIEERPAWWGNPPVASRIGGRDPSRLAPDWPVRTSEKDVWPGWESYFETATAPQGWDACPQCRL